MTLRTLSSLVVVLSSLACGPQGPSGPGSISDQAGPEALSGTAWKAPPTTVNGIQLALQFQFDQTTVTASSTCDGTLTATARAPVKYRYRARITQSASKEEKSGSARCQVDVAAGSFDFVVTSKGLEVTWQGQTLTFQAKGGVSGLYGTWTAPAPGVGTLEWSLGNGKVSAAALCDGGLVARVEAPAEFTNILEVLEAAQKKETLGGQSCEVGIAKGEMTYVVKNGELVLTQNGGSLSFERGAAQ